MTRDEEKGVIDSCLNKSQPEEPVFTLCARDPLAAACVDWWAYLSQASGLQSGGRVTEAKRVARDMRAWRTGIALK